MSKGETWSPEDDRAVITGWKMIGRKGIGEKIGRTPDAVKHRRAQIVAALTGLPRDMGKDEDPSDIDDSGAMSRSTRIMLATEMAHHLARHTMSPTSTITPEQMNICLMTIITSLNYPETWVNRAKKMSVANLVNYLIAGRLRKLSLED